ncbi:MAG: thioredoxin domain-containing protein [Chitinophagaceae bacterium]|nr:thioredoxin domain-containing protein [Chitinophagaceae bacterium]
MKSKKDEVPIKGPKEIIIGNPDAPVTITEFGDYESEACARIHPVVKEIMETYEGRVNFNFRHFPLVKIHQKAHKAAEAAIAASQEGKFWEMHEIILSNRKNLGTISLKSYAKEIGTTNKDFLNNLINGKFGWNVQDDLNEGLQLGIKDVPAFFINGKEVKGNITLKTLKEAIDEALNVKKKTKAVA